MAKSREGSPEVLRSGRPLPIPSLLDYRHSPSAGRSPPREGAPGAPRGTTPRKDSATLGRISFNNRTRYPSSPTSARRPSSGWAAPPTVTGRAAGREIALSPAPLSRSPSALQHRPLNAIHLSLRLHAVSFGGLSAATLRQRSARAPLPEAAPPMSGSPGIPFNEAPPLKLRLSRPDQNGPDPTPPRTALPAYSRPPNPTLTTRQVRPEGRAPASRRPESRLVARDFFRSVFPSYSLFFGPRGRSNPGHLSLVYDPSAGSPTETLLRLLLPLKDQVRTTFSRAAQRANPPRHPAVRSSH